MATFNVHEQHKTEQKKKYVFLTVSAFYLFKSLDTILFSLSKGKWNLFDEEISIPNWGSHWSYV